MIFSADSILRFNTERGFSESFYIVCPVCWTAGIRITRWEDGTEESTGCLTCRRREDTPEKEKQEIPADESNNT